MSIIHNVVFVQKVFNNASPHVALNCSDRHNLAEDYGRVGYISFDREPGASAKRLQVHKTLADHLRSHKLDAVVDSNLFE